jgi:hypothetical protein
MKNNNFGKKLKLTFLKVFILVTNNIYEYSLNKVEIYSIIIGKKKKNKLKLMKMI